MFRKQNIVYVNFSQYDNVGRILDFLRENFSVVIHFSYDHLRLKQARPSYLRLYENGKLVKETQLIKMRMPGILQFLSLPIIGILIIGQTLFWVLILKKKYKSLQIFLTFNAFSAWIGNLMRNLKLVKKTVFWVGDYFPPTHPQWQISIARKIYWIFDRKAIRKAGKLIFTNKKILSFLQTKGIIQKSKINYQIIPIGCKVVHLGGDLNWHLGKSTHSKEIIVGFLGMIKENQGIELIFEILPKLKKRFPSIKLEIIGSGPQEEFYKKRAKNMSDFVKFFGFIENQDIIQKIIQRWSIGLAPYKPDKNNPSHWCDPSKIKFYLSVGVPVLTTDVTYMSREIKKNKAGIIINYNNHEEIIKAVETLLQNNNFFSKNAYELAKKYDYKKIYQGLFKSLS